MDQDHLPAFLIARRLGVSRQLVYWWTRNDKLPTAATAEDGRPLYSLRTAAEVERNMRRSPRSRRVAAA